MTARVSSLPLEVATSGELTTGVPVRVAAQNMEVQSTQDPPVRLSSQELDVLNTLDPPARLSHLSVEVLSSSVDALFDRSFGFWATEPQDEVIERYQWVTDVQTARSGAQVRVSLRSNPSVQVEFDIVTKTVAESTLIDALINGWQGRSYYLPVWQDRLRLGVILNGTETQIEIPNVEKYQYTDGSLVGLWTSETEFQILQILEVDEDLNLLKFAAPIGRGWLQNTWVAPIRRAWLQAEASAARFTGESMEARLVFDARDEIQLPRYDWGALEEGEFSIDGMTLFSHVPNWTQAPRITYRRRFETFGDETVPPWRYDPSAKGWITRQEMHTMTSREEINRVLHWAAHRRGRARAFLAPVRDRAITVTRSNNDYDAQIFVTNRNYSSLLPEISPRSYIALRDATGWILRRIVNVESFGAEEALSLNASIDRAGTPAGWLEAYLCEPAHLSADVLEVRWWNGETADIVISHEQVIE